MAFDEAKQVAYCPTVHKVTISLRCYGLFRAGVCSHKNNPALLDNGTAKRLAKERLNTAYQKAARFVGDWLTATIKTSFSRGP